MTVNQCFDINLEEPHAAQATALPPPSCHATTFLCARCRKTCGFCDSNSALCTDELPTADCLSYSAREDSLKLTSFVSLNSTLERSVIGHCDAEIPHSTAVSRGGWSFANGEFVHSKRRPSVEGDVREGQRCFAGRTTVFMGDSNARYQYLSLATLLSTGAYPKHTQPGKGAFSVCSELSVVFPPHSQWRPKRGASLAEQHNSTKHNQDLKWKLFFNQSSHALRGHEVCECDRSARSGGYLGIENRWFEHQGVRLAFLRFDSPRWESTVPESAWLGGFDAVRQAASVTCKDSGCSATPEQLKMGVAVGWLELYERRLARILNKGDVFVMGPGPWYKPAAHVNGTLRHFMLKVKGLVGRSGHALFKTCPRGALYYPAGEARETRGCGNGPSCDEMWRRLVKETGWGLLDAFASSEELWAKYKPLAGVRHYQRILLEGRPGERTSNCTTGIQCKLGMRIAPYTDNHHMRCEFYNDLNRQLVQLVSRPTSADL